VTFDYGNNIRAQAQAAGVADAFAFPGFVPAFIRPLFCEGKGPFRWAALSGDAEDIRRTDQAILRLFPEDESLRRWITMAEERVAFQGLPARICWLGYGERVQGWSCSTGRQRRAAGADRHGREPTAAASLRRTAMEGMRDGSDAIADWPLLNALVTARRRDLGEHPSRRWDRNRPPARRHGRRRRRHRPRGAEARGS
jgi:urocanate hydratase